MDPAAPTHPPRTPPDVMSCSRCLIDRSLRTIIPVSNTWFQRSMFVLESFAANLGCTSLPSSRFMHFVPSMLSRASLRSPRTQEEEVLELSVTTGVARRRRAEEEVLDIAWRVVRIDHAHWSVEANERATRINRDGAFICFVWWCVGAVWGGRRVVHGRDTNEGKWVRWWCPRCSSVPA